MSSPTRRADALLLGVTLLAVFAAVGIGVLEASRGTGEGVPATMLGGVLGGQLHAGVDPLRPPGLPEGAAIDPATGRLVGLRAPDGEGVRGLAWEDLALPADLVDLADVPASVRALEGQEVALVGFVSPAFEPVAFRHFFLVASTFACCFGQPPGLDGLLEVRLAGASTPLDMDPRPHVVRGRLRIEPLRLRESEDAPIVLLFHLDEAQATALGDGPGNG